MHLRRLPQLHFHQLTKLHKSQVDPIRYYVCDKRFAFIIWFFLWKFVHNHVICRLILAHATHRFVSCYHLSVVHYACLVVYTVYNYKLPFKVICMDEWNLICRVLYKDCVSLF